MVRGRLQDHGVGVTGLVVPGPGRRLADIQEGADGPRRGARGAEPRCPVPISEIT